MWGTPTREIWGFPQGLNRLRKNPEICVESPESLPQGLKAPLISLRLHRG